MTAFMQQSLPNFFLIGAAKSGTTSMFDVLKQHPQIYTPRAKECLFFNNDGRYNKGLDWYYENFFKGAAGQPIRLDATPSYLTWSEKVAPRIKKDIPHADLKFCAIFRDPVKRAYSHYWHRVRMGDEDLPFEDAMAEEEARLRANWEKFQYLGSGQYGYFRAGCYAGRLQPFLDLFPRERFCFFLQEDLINSFDLTFSKLLGFLEVEQVVLQPVHSNVSSAPRNRKVYDLLRRTRRSSFRKFLKSILPESFAINLADRMNALALAPFNYPPMSTDTDRRLRERYRPEIDKLEVILGRDLSSWKQI